MKLKEIVRTALGPEGVKLAKKLLGRTHLSEVELVSVVLLKHSKSGVMFDVGAHHGYELEAFVHGNWQVVAFEPDHDNLAVLRSRFGHNPLVKIDTRAVSEKAEKGLSFYASDVSTGISGLLAFHESHEETQKVDTTTVAEAMTEHGIDHVNFLKTDIEGYDFFAIKGVDWARDKPDVIVCEYENRKTTKLGYTVDDVVSYLRERGYEVTLSEWFPIVEYGRTHKWKQFTADPAKLNPDGWGNLIAYQPLPGLADLQPERLAAISKRLYG